MKTNYDFIGIGDIVTDAFIRIKEASLYCDINKEDCKICFKFAEKIPYENVYIIPAVGNSANACFSAVRLGLKTALVSNIGDDYYGQECLNVLRQEDIGTEYIKIHKNKKTNYHYVLWYNDDRTILIKHQKYIYKLPDIGNPRWLYLSSLGEHSLLFHQQISSYLNKHTQIKLAFQPGTYQIRLGVNKLRSLYARAEVFFCNKEEAKKILATEISDIKQLLLMVKKIGPKIVVITDSIKGAYVFNGHTTYFMPPYPDPKPPYERTGAGDAFSSTFTVALACGKDIITALKWAPINSMSVVQKVGAREGLLARNILEKYVKKAPKNYQSQEI